MKLDSNTIRLLTQSVDAHWSAIQTYTAQAAHFKRWGYPKLAAKAAEDAKEELTHVMALLERLELGDATVSGAGWPRHNIVGILTSNLSLENAAASIERNGIETARESADEGTAHMFADNLEGSESGIREIEAAQRTIEQIGVDNFLAAQI